MRPEKTPYGVIYFGSTSPAMREALDVLEAEGHASGRHASAGVSVPRVGQPFIATHDKVFVVEQNRDAQMRSMLVNELDILTRRAWFGCCTMTVLRSPHASLSRRFAKHSTRVGKRFSPGPPKETA
jgi:hypothetical protein